MPQEDSIEVYQVSASDYFSGLVSDEAFSRTKKKVQGAMRQLIEMLGLRDMKVLSVGPGLGYEEYWFHENGCSLTLIDIDETTTIKSYLATLPEGTGMKYFIGDARQVVAEIGSEFDLVYFSGFTPDEMWRSRIYSAVAYWNMIKRRLVKRERYRTSQVVSWPRWIKPLTRTVLAYSRKLKQGGLLISQKYAGGIDVVQNRHFIDLIRGQLGRVGVELIAFYYFKAKPDVSLTIGYKGNRDQALRYLDSIRSNPEITAFHGRSEIQSEIVRAY